mmetsp:Transcript_6273/g.9118  ORF Transcript_6273/g.9118 Transcript_6273/m.9118 type:complete len:200 (-) Transcript_6273:17-616(-)
MDIGLIINHSPLHYPCQTGNFKFIKEYIEGYGNQLEVDLNKKSMNGSTPIQIACFNGHHNIVRYLLNKKVRVDTQNNFKRTPFATACTRDIAMVRLFLRHEEFSIKKEDSMLLTVCALVAGNHDVADLLVEHGVDVHASGLNDITALSCACFLEKYQMVNYLMNKGANVHIQVKGLSLLHLVFKEERNHRLFLFDYNLG